MFKFNHLPNFSVNPMHDVIEISQLCKTPSHALIDVRDFSAWLKGVPIGAKTLSPEQLLSQAASLAEKNQKIYVICYKGQLSQSLCLQLSDDFDNKFVSVSGGFEAWQHAKLPVETPLLELQEFRYERQIKLPGFGQSAQNKLKQSHVLVVGAGGLG
ncbi:MAG: rhodanese-like domain-containing protein, partial [Marinicella sp.]